MILNVSGRTDIPAFYSDWFYNRYKEGFFDVRNPFYKKNISRIYFKDVDLIVFCTKNPIPLLKYLKDIDKPILFHITLTPYKKDLEPFIPPKGKIITAIKKVSNIVGIDNVYVRYDPVLINDKYTLNYHIKAFDHMCKLLNGYVKHIIISFIDNYKNVEKNKDILNLKEITKSDLKTIGINFSKSAKENNMTVQTCSEKENLKEYGFIKKDCIDFNLVYKKTGKTNLEKWKSRNNKYCNCVKMIDIGQYNTCKHFCKYCYANYNEKEVIDNFKKHNLNSTLLIGNLEDSDLIKIRKD